MLLNFCLVGVAKPHLIGTSLNWVLDPSSDIIGPNFFRLWMRYCHIYQKKPQGQKLNPTANEIGRLKPQYTLIGKESIKRTKGAQLQAEHCCNQAKL